MTSHSAQPKVDLSTEFRNGERPTVLDDEHVRAVEDSQDASHGDGHDYIVGSPHLRHAPLRRRIDERIASVVRELKTKNGDCTVLEVGAGHGSFTDTVLAAGGSATITEMSKASADFLSRKFCDDSAVRVLYDTDGNAPFRENTQYDVVLLISVIHHIPDYVDAITRLCDNVLRPGGAVITFQDPLWYPRQSRSARALSWGSYFAWRLTQGELRRGLATRWRRFRGTYSETEPSDLVEYHVVRDGVDELKLCELFEQRFRVVELDQYFSTQSPPIQSVGAKLFPVNTFGLLARERL